MSLQFDKESIQEKNTITASRELEKSAAAPQPIDYAALASQLVKGNRDDETLNRLGVCYLRQGKIAEALQVYRQIALQPGGVCERTDLPEPYVRNFATALLLSGLPSGCMRVLRGLSDQRHPRMLELYAAIRTWERSLSFLQRWDWRINSVDPKNAPVAIDFEPGEMV